MAKQRCSKHPFYYEPCTVCAEIRMHKERIQNLEEQGLFQYELRTGLEAEVKELSETLEKALNSAYKSYNPEAKLKLSVNDLFTFVFIFS